MTVISKKNENDREQTIDFVGIFKLKEPQGEMQKHL